jgi:hypothetical protein
MLLHVLDLSRCSIIILAVQKEQFDGLFAAILLQQLGKQQQYGDARPVVDRTRRPDLGVDVCRDDDPPLRLVAIPPVTL